MYAVIVFALVLLSPMPFVSPFGHIVQDVAAQSPFGPFEPATSPSFIIEPNAQEFGIKSDLVHSPAGTFYHDAPWTITIPVIDNHTYAVTSSDSGTDIRNITNITSPTKVSDLPTHPGTVQPFKTLRIQHIVIDNSTYVLGSGNSGYFHIANISDVDNPDSLYRSNLNSVLGNAYLETARPVIINESPYVLIGNNYGGIIIMSLASPDNPNLVHYIKSVAQNTSSEYTKLGSVSGLTTITIEESVYALATNAKNGAPYGLTIINITTPSSPSLVYNGTLGIGQSYFVSTVTIDESIYAIAQTNFPQSITIINITNPYSPEVASTITKGDTGYLHMNNPSRIATTTFGTSTFALVTDANFANSGVQIIDITNPYAPSPVSAITHGQDNYTHLNQAVGINIVTLDGQTYALVAGRSSDGVQIIKLDYSTLISLTSNNANPAYAKAGDTLELEFSATDTINSTVNAAILGDTVGNNFFGETFTTDRDVPSREIERYANFMVTVVDNAGNTLVVTEDDLSSNIFVDTKRPQISLIGDADLEVFPLTEESSIPGATATDGDPNYAGNYTITTTGNLSATPLGSTVIFTYTAADDGAGNAGHSTTRTVTVGQPNIIHFTSLNIASSSGDNFARAGQSITVSLVTDGSELGNFTGTILGKQFTSTPNGGSVDFTVVATPDDPYENATFLITLTNASGNNITLTNAHITDGSYVTVDAVSPTITLHDPDDVTIFTGSTAYVDPGATAYDASYGNKTVYGTGTVNTLISGTYPREYKAPDDDAGNTGQIVIRTVTVMPKPFEFIRSLGVYEGPSLNRTTVNDATFNSVRAMASIQINDSTYIMAATDRSTDEGIRIHAVHIFDITDIDSPRLVNKTVFHDNNGISFLIEHITISTIDGNTYAVASASSYSSSSIDGVLIINISNPESPSLVTYVTNDQNFAGLDDPRRIAVTTIGEFTYALVPSAISNGVQIINITNPATPTPVIAIKDKESGGDYDTLYGAEGIAIINTDGLVYALVTARDDDGVQIIDITNISNPIPVSSIVDNNKNSSSPYTALDDPRGIDTISIGESIYALVASYIDDGVQIINITNPENPSSASAYAGNELIQGSYDVSTITIGESIYALSTAHEGDTILLFDITNPAHPQFVHRLNDYGSSTAGMYHDLASPQYITMVTLNTSTYALVSSLYGGIQVINLASPDVSVFSNNTNNHISYAKTGDSLNITLMATDIISSGSATILGLDADVSHVGENFTASVIVPSTIQEEYANFTVTLENNYGDTIILARDNSAYSNQFLDNVFVDNIAPTISLDGSYQYYLVQNRSINTIPTVTVTDGDPKYPKKLEDRYTITTSNDLNTSKIGSTAIFTYTAEPDGVGNPGPSVTRNVTIVGYSQIDVTSLTVSSDNSVNSSYAKAGDNVTITIETDGIIETITGNILGGGNFMKSISSSLSTSTLTLTKTITQSDTNGNLTFNIFATNSSNYAARATHEDLTTSNIIIDTISPTITLNGINNTVSVLDRAYADLNATAYDLSYGSKNVPPTGTVDIGTEGNNTLTYSAPSDLAGNEAQNITRNVIVLDLPPISLTSGLNVYSAGSFDIATSPPKRTHVSTFQIDTATYAGISTEEGLFIMNITDIRSPSNVSTVFNASLNVSVSLGVQSATFVSLDGLTYALSVYGSSVLITDVTNPASPSYVSHVSENQGNFTELLDAASIATAIIGSSTYALVASNFDSGVQIIDITDPYDPIATSTISHNSNNFELSGANYITTATIGSSTYALVENGGGVQIIDITTPSVPIAASFISDNTNNITTLADPRTIATATIGSSTYALVASQTEDGIQIINITDPYDPIAASSITDSSSSYTYLDGAIYVTTEIINSRTYALVASQNDDSLQFIDITNPYKPTTGPTASDGVGGYTELDGIDSIATATIGSSTYAITSSRFDTGIQIVQMTPSPALASDNLNYTYAKAGDTLTLEFTVNDTIVSSTTQFTNPSQIPSISITNATSSATYRATLTVPSDPIEEYAEFTITVENNQSVSLSITKNDLHSNVFVDTIAPRIELVGDASHIVYVGTQNPIIPGATAYDGSPGYSASYSTSITGNLNTSIIGSNVTYTYTAHPDTAGNLGESVTRNVTVVDYEPITVTSLIASSDNSVNSSYAKVGDEIRLTLTADAPIETVTGDILGDDNFTVSQSRGDVIIRKTINQNDINGNLTFDIFVSNSSGYAARITQDNLTSSTIIIDTIPPIITLKGTNNTVSVLDRTYTDQNATAYDLSYGSINIPPTGTVDINNEGNYTLTYSAQDDLAGNEAQNITRNVIVLDLPPISLTSGLNVYSAGSFDIATSPPKRTHVSTFQIDTATYAGISTEEGLFIMNITDIRSPSNVSTVFNASLNVSVSLGVQSATFVSLDGLTYALSVYGSSVLITDVTNPASPSYVSHVSENQGNFTELLDAASIATAIIGSSTYALVASNFDSGVQIIDITDPYDPIATSTISHNSNNFELSGANYITTATIGSSTYALVENGGGVQIIDITTPSVPIAASFISDNTNNITTLADPRTIATATIGSSTYALVASQTEDGIQIINITDPYDPIAASSITDSSSSYTYLDGAIYVTTEIINSRTYALVASQNDDSLQFIDITNPYKPTTGPTASDGVGGYTELDGIDSIATATIGSSTYAITSSRFDTGIQIVQMTPSPALASDNLNYTYAKAGDTLTLEFTVNDTIVSHTAQFTNPDQIPSVTINDVTYIATLTVPSDPIEKYAEFIITVENNETVSLSVTENDLHSNVFVDTIAPRIELVGDASHIVYVGTQNPIIPGATAYDGSPGYSASYSTSITGNLNTSIIGSNVTYTYTAHPDTAGNLGESVTRNVTVVDYEPITVTSLIASSDNSVNSSYAKVGDEIRLTLTADAPIETVTGDILGDDNFTVSQSRGDVIIRKTINQNDINGNLTFDIFVSNSSGYAARIMQNDLTSSDIIIIDTVPPLIYLYGINNTISNLGSPYVDAGAISYDLSYGIKDVTGTGTVDTSTAGTYHITYDAPDFAGNPANIIRTVNIQQLAPISLTDETSQFLVSPTANVSDSADYPYLGDSYRVTTVKIGDSTYALIAAHLDYGFTILNITTPEFPTLVFNVTGDNGINANIRGPTGISTIQIQNSIYAVITSLLQSRVTILDITNPTLPIVKSITTPDDNANIHSPFAVSTVDIDDSAYAIVASRTNSKIAIFNITNPMNLTQVSVLEHGADYTLEGVTITIPIKMDNSTYILTAARDNNSVGIIDISDPKMPKQVALFEDDLNLGLHSAHSIETISINGRTYALVASPGEDAMQILDITHPLLPFPVSTVRHSAEYPALLAPHDVTAIKVEDSTYALLSAVNADSVQIIDITNPESPRPVSHITHGTEYVQLDRPQTLKAVQIDGVAYTLIAARNSSGVQIIKLEHEKTTQTPFSITSNNANSSYAKAGDTVSIQITVNDTIYSQTTQILNLATHTVFNSNTINASVTIPTDSIEMNASITASITNYLGVTLDLTETDLIGQNVFVDTVSPKIELTGDVNHTIFVNSNYVELGAVASDGDPNYTPNYTITPSSSSLNTTMVGSFELYTYIADPDAAGNLGENVTRNVTVVDYTPITVTSLIASSDNSVNGSYAKIGDEIRLTLTADAPIETVTGVVLGDDNLAVSHSRGDVIIRKTINQNDTNGNLTFDIFVSNSSGYAARITQNDLTSSGIIIIDTVHPLLYLYGANNTVSYVGSSYVDAGAISYDISYGIQNVTGTSTVTGTAGTYDVTYDAPDFAGNPANIIRIVHVQDLPQLSLSSESSDLLITPESPIADPVQYPHLTDPFHIETVQIDGSTYALVASNIDSGFTILNMDNPESPSLVFNATRTQTNYSAIQGILGASPIQIQGKTYVVTISSSSKILIADITNPESTTFVSERSNGTDYPYLHDMTAISTFSIGDAAYAMIVSQSGSWVSILNITETANPTHLTVLENGANYDLNSPRHIAIIDADGSTFAVITSRTTGTVTILNMDNPEMPVQIHAIKDGIGLALSSATGIELVQINTRTYALVVSNLDNAMQIIDITHPQLPFPVSTVQKSSTEYSGLSGPHYVAALQVENATYAFVTSPLINSTQVINITNPFQPNPVAVLQNGAEYTHLAKPLYIESIQTDDAAYALVGARTSNGIEVIKLGYEKTTQTPFSITSNNANSSYAKEGDTVSIQITVNDTIDQSKSTVQIQNLNANVNKTSLNTIEATVTILTDSIEINASITALITSYLGATLDLTETDLTAQNVFIDTISPTMKLIGDANHVVIVNNIYSEPGAIAIDGSPGYNASNYSVIVTGSLNTSMIDSTVNYTYTAYPDAAGNLGTSINRTVTIVDYAPLNVVSLNVSSNNSVNNSYAKAGDNVTITLVTDGSDVETATGDILDDNNFAKNPSGNTIIFSKIITQSDPNGNLTFDILVTNSSGYAARVTQDNLANSNIIIDTIPPTITLNGENDTISILNRAYTDANATAYDLSYGEKSISPNGIVNTNVIGNYSLSYTAESDLAGNAGPTITRNVIVKDLVSFEIQILSVTSTNVNNASYAKIGDDITVRLAVNDTIATHDVEILNDTLSLIVTNSTNEINATLSVPNNLAIEKYATFNIGIENSLTIPINVTQENITGSNIFVDTIPPAISINGDITEYSLLQNRSTDMIPNATATDGDPNYAGTYTVTNNSILNTSILGASATYTYTADPDGAGNLGSSVDLIVTVTDYTQLNITALTVSSDNSNSSYAKAGDQVNITLITDGSDIASITGAILGDASFTQQNSSGTITLSKIITQSDTNGNLTFDIFVTNSTGSAARVTQENILNNNNIIIDTVSPLLYLYGVNNTVSYVGSSYVDAGAISYDISYGIQNVTGTSTVTGTVGTYDVTYDAPDFAGNPANIMRIVHVQELPQLALSSESSDLLLTPESPIADPVQYPHLTDPFHIETVQIDGSTYALVASNTDSGFTILNMDNPESPSLVFNATRTQTNYSAIQGILGASPIQIQGKTYVVTISSSSKILIADITNPESTTFVSERSNGTDYPYLHAMTAISTFSIGDAAYAMIVSQSGSWVSILNITETANPTHLTVLENGANYDLNSPRHIAIIDADGSTFAVITSRTTGTVTILNMDNPEMPVQIHAIKDGIGLALSSATGIELVEINTRTYALVASNLDNAMQIIDITHPQLPFPVSTVQKSGTEYSGLSGPHYVAALQVENATYAFVTSPSTNSTQVIDITNPFQPNPVAVLQNGTEYTHLAKPLYIESIQTDDAAYALVASRGSDGIEIIKLGYDITTQTPFSITSNNANSSYAKEGDTVSIQITVNDTIDQSKSTVQIQNLNAIVSASGLNTIEATVTIPTDSIEINASITALITSYLGATLDLTATDLTAKNVFVDTIAPTITPIGGANYAALVGTSYTDQGANAYDGSPGYNASNYSTSKTGNVNTSDIGSIVTYTYTAYDDAAGNPGASATRIVTVVDHEPINVTSLTVSSNNSINNSYAKAGDEITIALVTDGSDITNITGAILGDASFTQQNSGGTVTLSKIITQSDTNDNLTFSIFVINSTDYASTVTQEDLTGENIIIDTISPTITLNGNSETVEFGSTYTDLGANIADASYEDRTIYSNTIVNTSMIGTYSLVYTAPDDLAGNLGPSVTRTINVSDSTPSMFNSLSLSTNNNNPTYAKAGDIITVTLIVNQPISNATITIQNEVVTHMIQNDTLYANYTIKNSQNGNPTLEITANFDSSLPLTVNESNLTTTIYIDTEKPIITLIGHSNITIPINLNYVDDAASVDDNDPSYNGNVSSNESEVNTAISDTYIIVYSADADNAGNIPDNVIRTVTVSDFFLGISSDNKYYDNLAKEGDIVSVKIISDPYKNSIITDATILGKNASSSIDGNTIYANATIQDSDANTNITFSITLNLTTDTLVTLTNDNLTSANVVVDTIAPEMLSATTVTPTLVEITFDEPIATHSLILRRTTMAPTPATITVHDGSTIPSSVLEFAIPPESSLSSDAKPHILIPESSSPSIRDLAGNGAPEISITVSDGIAPSMQSAIVVSPSLIEVIFDEDIKFTSANALFHPAPTVNGIPTDTPKDISGNILRVPSENAFPSDTTLSVTIATNIITDIAGNIFEPGTILTSAANVLVPYTVDEITIHIPYAMTLNLNTLSTDDYSITFGSNPPSSISTVDLSTDAITVILTMNTPFGTGNTPFVEQIGDITDTFSNAVTLQSAIADDRAPPTLVSVVASSPSDIIVTFSEKISSKSTNIQNYDLSGATIRNTGLGVADGTVVISTGMFVRASISISNSTTIEDISNNTVQGGVTQSVIKN